jgi:hypothetical protein
MSIGRTPEVENIVKSDRAERRIFKDVHIIIPQHEFMAVDLPKDHQRREDQEAHQDARKP